jgi:ferredoxin
MKKYTIELDRETCICTHNCTAEAPEFWLEAEDGKIDLAHSAYNEKNDRWELVAVKLNEKDHKENLMAMKGCPVDAIKIEQVSK